MGWGFKLGGNGLPAAVAAAGEARRLRAIWRLVLVLVIAAVALVSGTRASERAPASPAVRTVATIRTHVSGFAQNARYLAWANDRITFLELRRRRRVTLTPKRLPLNCPVGASDMVVARNRAYWTSGKHPSNVTFSTELCTAAVSDRRIREVDFQSIYNQGFDALVPPASDGMSAYFWRSPEDATPGPIVRYDGRTRKRVTGTVNSLRALAAGGGRFAAADAIFTYNCAQDPAWSPDGRRIAYSSYAVEFWYLTTKRPCVGGLWLMNADGTRPNRIRGGRSPDWSPDGNKLIYQDERGSLVVSNRDGSGAKTVVSAGHDPAWSPGGTAIAFSRGTSTYVVGPDGSGERFVAANAVQPDWSPDGTRLIFARPTGPAPGLGIVDADGTNLRLITTGFDSQPAWSPDGRSIAFVHCIGSHFACPTDDTEIDVIAPDGSGRRSISRESDETADLSPSWAPDSRRLVIARQRGWQDYGDSHIWTLAPARRLTRVPPPRTPLVVRSRAGKVVARFRLRAPVTKVAVSSRLTAALVRDRGRWRVEFLAPVRRTVPLTRLPGAFAASGSTLILNEGRSIYALAARRGGPRLVARAAASPIGLSIVARRVAWAENLRRGARIRMVLVGE